MNIKSIKYICVMIVLCLSLSCSTKYHYTIKFNPWYPKLFNFQGLLKQQWVINAGSKYTNNNTGFQKRFHQGFVSIDKRLIWNSHDMYYIDNNTLTITNDNVGIYDISNEYSLLYNNYNVYLYDKKNRNSIWDYRINVCDSMIVYNNLLYVLDTIKKNVVCIDISTGKPRWEITLSIYGDQIENYLNVINDKLVLNTKSNLSNSLSTYLIDTKTGMMNKIDNIENTYGFVYNCKLLIISNYQVLYEYNELEMCVNKHNFDVRTISNNCQFNFEYGFSFEIDDIVTNKKYIFNPNTFKYSEIDGRVRYCRQYQQNEWLFYIDSKNEFIGIDYSSFSKNWIIKKTDLSPESSVLLSDENGVLVVSNEKLINYNR